MFDFEDLQTFVAVADAGGVTPGARRLGLSKSIVSRRLMRLEEQLGVQLLARTTRGAALTDAGATFREHAVRVVAELEAAREAVSSDGALRGLLRVTAPLSFGPTHLAPLFAEFALAHPHLRLQVSYSDAVIDLVGEGYDAAVRIGYLADSTLVARRIASVPVRIVASPAYIAAHGAPKIPEDIAKHEALLFRTEPWPMSVRGKTVQIHARGRFKADNGVALVEAAAAGLGITMAPAFLTDDRIASGSLVALLREYEPPEVAIYVVRPPGTRTPRNVAAMIDFFAQRLGDRG